MIRINLLPFRAARRKENIRRQISIFGLSVLLLFSVMGWIGFSQRDTLEELRRDHARMEEELSSYAGISAKLSEIREKTAEIRAKMGVIAHLNATRTGPVHILEQVAFAVPKDRLWLELLEQKGGVLTLKGTAMDHNTVALFMNNLEKSPYVTAVDLHSTRLRAVEAYRIKVSDFVLSCRIEVPVEGEGGRGEEEA